MGPPLSERPAWVFQPSIGVDIGATDNVYRVNSPRRGDLFTIISPAIAISGDTARTTVNLSYSPQITIYANTSSQSQVSHYFDGQSHTIIVPDAVFLDLRGYSTLSSITGGGLNQYQTQSYNAQNSVQTTSVSARPYVEHRFGGWGTGQLSYTISRTLQDSGSNQPLIVDNSTGFNAVGRSGYGTLGNLTTQTESGTFTSGENLGRFQDRLLISATQYNGGGSYRGAYRREVQDTLDFALTHSITLLTGIGYEQVSYGPSLNTLGARGYHLSGPTYTLGVRYSPNPDLSLTVQYGQHGGSNNVDFQGLWSPTARTRVVASYSTGITTDLEQSQNYLNSTSVGPGGLVTDTATGAPVSNSGYSGLQNGVYRLKRFSASVVFLQDRDSYALNFNNDDRTTLTSAPTLIGNTIVPAGTSTNTTSFGATWQHDLAPDMSFTATAQYGISTNTGQLIGLGGSQDQRTLSFSASLTKAFTATLTGSVRYLFVDQSGGSSIYGNGLGQGSYTQNTLLVGLRKSF